MLIFYPQSISISPANFLLEIFDLYSDFRKFTVDKVEIYIPNQAGPIILKSFPVTESSISFKMCKLN